MLSRNAADVQCRVEGGLRPAQSETGPLGDTEPAICCADYQRCQIWRVHKEVHEFGPSTKRQRDQALTGPRPHVLDGDLARETLRA